MFGIPLVVAENIHRAVYQKHPVDLTMTKPDSKIYVVVTKKS